MTTPIEKLDKNFVPAQVADGTQWFDVTQLGLEGKGWDDTETYFDRLPAKAKALVRDHVWTLSQCSAGMAVRFVTDATTISAKWKLRTGQLAMNHMPATGVSGLDLYAKDKGKWLWAGVGIPSGPENSAQLAAGLLPGPGAGGKREFLLYLPLYNGVTSMQIGIPEGTTLARAPRRPAKKQRGVLVYGTSIVQGGCACRAGMGYPEIMGRALDCHTINLGFSGNGPMELEIARLIAELDPAVYVIDCLPNMGAPAVTERAEPFVDILRKARPKTPIVLVESIMYQREPLQPRDKSGSAPKNANLKAAYLRMLKAGVKGLTYLKGDKLLGNDTLGTVDGCHPTDVGFLRMAQIIGAAVKKVM